MAAPLVLLHGFAQTGAAWDPVRAALPSSHVTFAPDLRGHGTAVGARPIDAAALVADVLALAPERFALAGYSMGGRLALQIALAAPERVTALVPISASAGLDDPAERAARLTADDALADEIERDGIEAFVARWESLLLWADQPEQVKQAARAQRLALDPAGLAASLRGFGTGAMTSVWDRLDTLAIPTTVVVGARDAKFSAIGARLAAAIPAARLHAVPDAGHALPLEAPGALAELLRRV